MPTSQLFKRPNKVIILSGIPGSGKSTWATNYLKNNSWTARIVSRDDIREVGFPVPYTYTRENEERVTITFNSLLKTYLSASLDVILDNTNCREGYIDEHIKSILVDFPNTRVYIKFFDVPLWKAAWRVWRRERNTGKVVPYEVVKAMHKNYKKINKQKYSKRIL